MILGLDFALKATEVENRPRNSLPVLNTPGVTCIIALFVDTDGAGAPNSVMGARRYTMLRLLLREVLMSIPVKNNFILYSLELAHYDPLDVNRTGGSNYATSLSVRAAEPLGRRATPGLGL